MRNVDFLFIFTDKKRGGLWSLTNSTYNSIDNMPFCRLIVVHFFYFTNVSARGMSERMDAYEKSMIVE